MKSKFLKCAAMVLTMAFLTTGFAEDKKSEERILLEKRLHQLKGKLKDAQVETKKGLRKAIKATEAQLKELDEDLKQ